MESIIFARQTGAMSKLEKIQNEILSLSNEERELIGIFVKNTATAMEPGYQDAWQTELEKRLGEVQNKTVNLVSTKSVIADLRKKISK
jgi:hypothetical protein